MRYLSVCSGIEAATVAWHPLGWKPVAFSEIEPFPCKVLAHHYPDVPNFGDMTKFKEWPDANVDVLVGGTPCQSFSIAGLRKGLADPRGNLMLTYLAIAAKYRPRWLVWENVSGVLSSNGGRDFASLLRGMGQLGYGFAYRVLDAQYFGVPQRRRRVFVVGCLGDWRSAAAVLFERHSLQGHTPPSRKAGKEVTEIAGTLSANGGGTTRPAGNANELDFCVTANRMVAFGEYVDDGTASALKQRDYKDATDLVTYSMITANTGANGLGVSEEVSATLDRSNGQAVAYPINTQIATRHNALGERTGLGIGDADSPAFTLQAGHSHAVAYGIDEECNVRLNHFGPLLRGGQGGTRQAVAFKIRGGCEGGGKGYLGSEDTAFTLSTNQDRHLFSQMLVRRLTPRECERLQGFPDDYTLIPTNRHSEGCAAIISDNDDAKCDCGYKAKPAADGPRYKALGNSMAVPVMRWIGERIQMVQNIQRDRKAA